MISSEDFEAECFSFESSDESGDEGEMIEIAVAYKQLCWPILKSLFYMFFNECYP